MKQQHREEQQRKAREKAKNRAKRTTQKGIHRGPSNHKRVNYKGRRNRHSGWSWR